ncbi:PP2C family protein-serine/threonine phosphatase [Polycyclovorans algicola]|uniref:PP2C family protein-serine/threonine phosphatase n=1 Tax=Polycyclovorans algicola TaxID=616992 RepID=UPI0004A76E5B|nr:protein phosphatase 2C domain-containing protein [Polycyclovorans algicola]
MTALIRGSGGTHVGKRRADNEDAWIWLEDSGVAVVADGMGGHDSGEVASNAIIDAVRNSASSGLAVELGLETAHQHLRTTYGDKSTRPPAATVIALSFLPNNEIRYSWAGDCRLYRCRDARVEVLSRDHSMVDELFRAGAITEAEARDHPQRSVVSRALGLTEHPQAKLETETVACQVGDRYLLCSDGLHGFLAPAQLDDLLRNAIDPQSAVDALIAATLAQTEAGDNLTAVCCFVDEPG